MNEGQAVSKWLYETLAATSAVRALVGRRLYDTLAPQRDPADADSSPEFPYVAWNLNSAEVTPAAGADRRVLVQARVVISAYADSGSFVEADAVAAAVDAALEGAASAVAVGDLSYWVSSAQMEQPLRLLETANGRRVPRVGGIYLILAHGMP